MDEAGSRPRNILWVIDIDYSTRHHHGAMLRFRNYSKHLIAGGRRVYWLVQSQSGEFEGEREFLEQLRDERALTDFFECRYSVPRLRTRLASLSLLPSIGNRWLAAQQNALAARCREWIRELEIDVCIVSSRHLLFLAERLRNAVPLVVDFIDSLTLYYRRESSLLSKKRDRAGWLRSKRYLAEWYVKERYYARLADASVVVSPVDKQALDEVSGQPGKVHVLLNGVSRASAVARPKIRGRLI